MILHLILISLSLSLYFFTCLQPVFLHSLVLVLGSRWWVTLWYFVISLPTCDSICFKMCFVSIFLVVVCLSSQVFLCQCFSLHVQIFPNDVYIGEIVDVAKSFRFVSFLIKFHEIYISIVKSVMWKAPLFFCRFQSSLLSVDVSLFITCKWVNFTSPFYFHDVSRNQFEGDLRSTTAHWLTFLISYLDFVTFGAENHFNSLQFQPIVGILLVWVLS